MSLTVRTDIRSSSCNPEPITVELLVLHATAADLEPSLDLLTREASQVSTHLVIAPDGTVFELVPCLEAPAQRAWHAGRSLWSDGASSWSDLNDWAIGVELVNRNGNLFDFTGDQYAALFELIGCLRRRYPALNDPNRVVGHEHVAGFRGKVDPGHRFDWHSLFRVAYPDCPAPVRQPTLPEHQLSALRQLVATLSPATRGTSQFWSALSALTERLTGSRPDTTGVSQD